MFLEGHYRVERKQESVEEQAKDIVNALVENDSLEERLSVFLLHRFDGFLDSALLVFQVVRDIQQGLRIVLLHLLAYLSRGLTF